ncbi:MAG: hypothetical protein QGG34_10695 [SAR202 cluster bacterium]|jgi:uncharacterized protein (UPF0333 family)|nr:hypothetical protein [SAR202 cluster bacterium]MDP6300108.1 hypothetical protein [SAR202 cluster bacterium]MDP7103485.1 hypothetical protein [SAR202 cluster bacterium]|tara:strand:- start:2643 stop:2864 length:222 start_codon:yes stop_codon:yes gene_type:complete
MKELPLIFPVSFLVILIAIFFTAAYAISEDALSGATPAYASAHEASVATGNSDDKTAENDWYQQAAIFVCPLH